MIEKGWGKRIQEARGAVSQTIVAAEFGTTKTTISNYEIEKTAPDLRFLIRFCERFGVTLDWIAFGTHVAPGTVELAILRDVIEAVEIETPESDPKTKAATISLLYNQELRVVNAERETAELKASAVAGKRKSIP
jgi:transcriptional regulator with XRE-family HTH domain